jgi:hypothetical protein
MALKHVGIYNNIPAEYMPKLPKRGTIITYRFLDYYNDPLSETDLPVFKAKLMLPCFSRFFDKTNNDWIEIGLVSGVDAFGNPIPNMIRRVWVEPQANAGYLNLTIGNAADDELFQYLELCSFNAANPLRDENVHPILERVDFEAEAREARNDLKNKMEAIKIAGNIAKEDLPRFSSLLGYEFEGLTEEEVRFNIESFAHEDSESFMDRIKDKHFDIKSYISLALDRDVVYIDTDDRKLKWSDSKGDIMRLVDVDQDEVIDAYAAWASKEKNGKDVHQELLSLLSKTKAKAKA